MLSRVMKCHDVIIKTSHIKTEFSPISRVIQSTTVYREI